MRERLSGRALVPSRVTVVAVTTSTHFQEGEFMWQGNTWLPILLFVALLGCLLLLWKGFNRYGATLWNTVRALWERFRSLTIVRRLETRFPRLQGFVARRFSREGFLGLHLTIGMLLSLLCVALFGAIAGDVREQDDLATFDVHFATYLHDRAREPFTQFFLLVTELGSSLLLGGVAIAGAVVLFLKGRRILLIGWLVAYAGGGVLNWTLKAFFRRERPAWETPLLDEQFWSFPSGHAMGALIGYGILAYLLLRLARRWWQRWLLIAVTTLLVLLIGFSRLYLGVHYFSDVVAGYAAGLLWLAVIISGLEVALRYRKYAPTGDRAGEPDRGEMSVGD